LLAIALPIGGLIVGSWIEFRLGEAPTGLGPTLGLVIGLVLFALSNWLLEKWAQG
jgi:hypothetical protein